MTERRRVGDLEIYQDLGFQERVWKVQRVAWAIILLALVGIVGTGPISSGEVHL